MLERESLHKTLKKITITAIHAVTDGSLDPLTLGERFEYANRIHMIIGPIQVIEFHRTTEDGYDLVLRFSPNYLRHNYYVLLGVSADFEWTLTLPEYIFTDYVDENENHQCDELGMLEWLTQSVVTVGDDSLAQAHWVHKDFEASFASFA